MLAEKSIQATVESTRDNHSGEIIFFNGQPAGLIKQNEKQGPRYLPDDHELAKKVKEEIIKYITTNKLEKVHIRIRDNEERGYTSRVRLSGNKEVTVSKFLTSDFCKANKISRFALINSDGSNGLSCDMDENNVRYYKVQNGSPIIMTLNWQTNGKQCSLIIELGTNNNVKVIDNNGVTIEDLEAHNDVRIGSRPLANSKEDYSLSLVEAVKKSQMKSDETISLPQSKLSGLKEPEQAQQQPVSK
ncbi:hypothetical protein [Wolbachia endosymbiont (group E) of Neria commutata]|uniref:hypothetical protein n=1 Tax=Wolbachia endosymbiont (group E) of Neria commutata TaxID=3066149 RepID=UPI003132F873